MSLLWITKTPQSKNLSRSEGDEQSAILFHARSESRRRRLAREVRNKRRARDPDASLSVTPPESYVDAWNARGDSRSDIPPTSCGWADSCCSISGTESGRCNHWPSLASNSSLRRDPSWTSAEARSAVYFHEIVVHKILTLKRDKHFWKGVVPYLAEVDISIRHLMVAIAATHELLARPHSSALNTFALQQCNKALKAILTPQYMSLSTLIASCILVTAYNLLRGDVEAADKSVQSGLGIRLSTEGATDDTEAERLLIILDYLSHQHGFKLWAADVNFQINRTVAYSEDAMVFEELPKISFTEVGHVLATFRTLMMEFIAKAMRNIALGTHIDPECSFAQDVSKYITETLSRWHLLYRSLPDSSQDEKLGLKQLKIGLLLARFLFYAKLLAADDLGADEHTAIFSEILQLGQEIIAARHAGRAVVYLDRIVNSAFFICSMFCREPRIRRQLIVLLKSQLTYTDGLVNFMRGRAAEIVAEIEEYDLSVQHCYDIPGDKRVGICTLECRADRNLCMGYMDALQTERINLQYHFSPLPPELDGYTCEEIEDCLKGIVAAFVMYRKQDLYRAPKGYVQEMYYGTQPVDLKWRADVHPGQP